MRLSVMGLGAPWGGVLASSKRQNSLAIEDQVVVPVHVWPKHAEVVAAAAVAPARIDQGADDRKAGEALPTVRLAAATLCPVVGQVTVAAVGARVPVHGLICKAAHLQDLLSQLSAIASLRPIAWPQRSEARNPAVVPTGEV